MKRFNRGGGLRQHLTDVHAEDFAAWQPAEPAEAAAQGSVSDRKEAWFAEISARADAMGVQPRRGAGSVRTADDAPRSRGLSFVGSQLALEEPGGEGATLQHPGLVAARDGDLATLLRLMAGGWEVFDGGSLDRHGASALDWAAGAGHLECVELLAPQAEGRVSCRRDGRGPAHWAARHGRTAVLQRLLAWPSGCFGTPNTRTTNGTTMLHLACYGGHVEAAEALLAAGAELGARNAWDCDAGHFAGMGGSVEICRWLAEAKGLALDRRQRSGHTALHKAADCGREKAIEYLLGHLGKERLALVGACSDAEQAVAMAEGSGGTGGGARPVTAPDGRQLTAAQMAERREAHLPSTLARNRGFVGCVDLLCAAGL